MSSEKHYGGRTGWLRAAVLGANDGILSTASIIVGVAAAQTTRNGVLVAGIAGLVAGAMSMAAGEYVSVSSQADTEKADLERERKELETNVSFEREELANIYVKRGLDIDLAKQVAKKLMEHDALGAHARDELGMSEIHNARPIQASLASAASFTIGGVLPVLLVLFMPIKQVIMAVSVSSLLFLALLGALSAKVGGANMLNAIIRVTFWGAFAMGITATVGAFFGVK